MGGEIPHGKTFPCHIPLKAKKVSLRAALANGTDRFLQQNPEFRIRFRHCGLKSRQACRGPDPAQQTDDGIP
jgi:hypothetical protein